MSIVPFLYLLVT